MKIKRGAVVSKKASANGKRACNHSQAWTQVVKAAREELKVTGFVAVGWKTLVGKTIYVKAKVTSRCSTLAPRQPSRKPFVRPEGGSENLARLG